MPDSKPREPREARLVAEWVERTYPGARVAHQARVGIIEAPSGMGDLSDNERAALRPFSRYVDAVVMLPRENILVEGTIRADPGKIARLSLYLKAFKLTEEFSDVSRAPTRLVLLSAIDDPFVRELAEASGVRFEVYQPPWVLQFLGTLRGRDRDASMRSF